MRRDVSTEEMTRRGFLGWGLAVFSGMASSFIFFLSALRMPLPSLLPGKSGKFRIGRKEDFPPGTARYFPDEQTYVFSDTEGIYAISAVCTHLGCIVSKEEKQFVCPCHGSYYDLAGKVKRGPAPRNLQWFQILLAPGDRLVVERSKRVPPGTKLLV
ncbi:MAG: ubiquinol-cytochrome c reductase iron-sulfur subunit [bacterium]